MDAGGVKSLTAQPFAKEEHLQALVADHPELLAWEQMNPDGAKRWILVRREQGIAKEPGAGDWWSVDHLFIDQDAVPTLVEVKRGANPQIRREVVGQMLEYAAHAWQTWTADSLRQAFEQTCSEAHVDPGAELRRLVEDVEDDDPGEFWSKVGANLAAKRLRLLFVADDIPDELTRIVEFLNATMSNVEVLAVEIKKFDGESGLRTLVPRVVGRTAKPANTRSRQLDRESFLAMFDDASARGAANRLLEVGATYGTVYIGTKGVSIRSEGPGETKPISVAWIFPSGASGWMGLKDFTFGYSLSGDVPPELSELIERWSSPFRSDEFASDVSGDWGIGWKVSASDAAMHVEMLADRLERVLTDLRQLGAR